MTEDKTPVGCGQCASGPGSQLQPPTAATDPDEGGHLNNLED